MSSLPAFSHTTAGPLLAVAVAFAAWRAGSLSSSGLMAATAMGIAATAAGWGWGVFLVGWFAVASVASRLGRRTKEARTGDVVAKGGRRDAWQVLANGGVFGLCALLAAAHPAWASVAGMAGASALVAAGADTLATEVGSWWRGRPWSLRTLGPVPAGTSGAVSLAGTAGMLVAAMGFATLAQWCGLVAPGTAPRVALAGISGALADTVAGAWWQTRRWCVTCERETEQNVHSCGTATAHHAGLPWLGNDAVNLLCTVVGGLMGMVSSVGLR